MTIDVSAFPKFGNMTAGSGIAAIFDGSNGTTGYHQGTVGWAGVNFSGAPKKIGKVEVVPPSNGFDASGSLSAITLQLMAKNGSAPSGPSDGTVLGAASFTDVNAQTPRTILSADTTTAWDYVWLRVVTGVWAIAAEIKFYEPVPIVPPVASPKNKATYIRSCNEVFPLPWYPVRIPNFDITFAVDEPCAADITFQSNATHRGELLSPQFLDVVGVGFGLVYKHADDFADLASAPWQIVENATSGFNIDERDPAHYGAAVVVAAQNLAPGYYTFGVKGSAHTTGDSRDGIAAVLAESGKGLNALRITVERDAEVIRL